MPIAEGGKRESEADLAKSLIPSESSSENQKDVGGEEPDTSVQVPQDEDVLACRTLGPNKVD